MARSRVGSPSPNIMILAVQYYGRPIEAAPIATISKMRDCVLELVGLEPTTRVLWNVGVSDQLTLSDSPHDYPVEAGITASGRLRVFDTLQGWAGEYPLYRRDEKGNPNQ